MFVDILILLFLLVSLFSGILLIVYSAKARKVTGGESCKSAISDADADTMRTSGIIISGISVLLIFVIGWRLFKGKQVEIGSKEGPRATVYRDGIQAAATIRATKKAAKQVNTAKNLNLGKT